jgi:hypothetical protein
MQSQPYTATAPPPPPVRVEPCVWMSAGLVAYKLCDRGFECESCPFDQAMRGELPPGPARPGGVEGTRADGSRRGGVLRPFRVGRSASGAPTIERGSGQGGDGSPGHGVSILQRTVFQHSGRRRGGR